VWGKMKVKSLILILMIVLMEFSTVGLMTMGESKVLEELSKINVPRISINGLDLRFKGFRNGTPATVWEEQIIDKITISPLSDTLDTCEVTYDVLDDLIKNHPKTIEKIVPKLKEVTFKVITETSTFEEYYLENLTRLIKQTIIKKDPRAAKNLISKLKDKLKHPSEEVRKRVTQTLKEIGEAKNI